MAPAPTRQSSPICGRAQQPRERFDHRVDAHLDVRIDGDRLRPFDGDAGQHQLAALALAQDAVGVGQFDARVDSQQLVRIVDVQRAHAVPVTRQDLRHVGQIQLARSRVGLKLRRCASTAAAPRKQ